jgi:hypothetical protein
MRTYPSTNRQNATPKQKLTRIKLNWIAGWDGPELISGPSAPVGMSPPSMQICSRVTCELSAHTTLSGFCKRTDLCVKWLDIPKP